MHANELVGELNSNLDWLVSRRWFADKARPIRQISIDLVDPVELQDTRGFLTIVRCSFEWGEDSSYFVPILDGDGPLPQRDALTNPCFLEWLVAGFEDERDILGRWHWRQIGSGFSGLEHIDFSQTRSIAAEQSNTSIVYDQSLIGKLFRKVQTGRNPDLEVVEHLMANAPFNHVPALYGVIELIRDDQHFDIMAVQEFVPNQGDGWSWLLKALADESLRQELLKDIALLGTRTAEMHLALAQGNGNESFAPQEIDTEQAEAIVQRVIAEMEGSVEGLTHVLNPDQVETLHKGLGVMMSDAWSLVGTKQIRVHGDYHLGQTLRTLDDDFAIIDFEGEPSRSMCERRQKAPALKDVAGMLRSLDYAAATIALQADNRETRAAVGAWVQDAGAAYVNAYKETIMESPIPLVPMDPDAFNSVLNLMIAEKALYETRYELNNRPDWLWIPLGALQRLVGTGED